MLSLVQDERRPQAIPFTGGMAVLDALSVPTSPPGLAADGESYEELRRRGEKAIAAGDVEGALQIFGRALEVAEATADTVTADLAFCNLASVKITLDPSGEDLLGRLREIVSRNSSAYASGTAAYHMSSIYEYGKEAKKALFYARIARDRAQAAEAHALRAGSEPTRIRFLVASAHNQLGNSLTADSFFAEAKGEYEQALKLLPEQHRSARAAILSNLGYVCIVEGDLGEAFSHLYRSLREYRRTGERLYEPWPHLDLCYAHLEAGRLRRAWQHGTRALRLAEELDDPNLVKLALFLMGTVEKDGGDLLAAYEFFARLQREYYPEVTNLPEMMMVVDARQVVNLRA